MAARPRTGTTDNRYLYILPVLFYEFLAIAVTRSVLPRLFVDQFGKYVYHIIGSVETVKGVLAFVSCPLFGKLSDKLGRKTCLMITVIGTTFPVCLLAFTKDLRVYCVAQVRENPDPFRKWATAVLVYSCTRVLVYSWLK